VGVCSGEGMGASGTVSGESTGVSSSEGMGASENSCSVVVARGLSLEMILTSILGCKPPNNISLSVRLFFLLEAFSFHYFLFFSFFPFFLFFPPFPFSPFSSPSSTFITSFSPSLSCSPSVRCSI